MNTDDPITKLGKFAADVVKNKIKGKIKKKIILPILGTIAPFLLVFIVIIIIIGGVLGISDSIKDFFKSDPELSKMTEEEKIAWINDPENLYAELENIDSILDLGNSNIFLMDKATVKRIFTRIHKYNQRRQKSTGQISYGNRVETYTGDMSSTIGSVNMVAMEDNGELPDNASAEYDTAWHYTEVYRSSVENEMKNDGTGRFDLRWQDIFVACALAARDKVDDHSLKSNQDMNMTDLDDLDLSEYYLTNDEIDDIIDIFYYEFDYLYDPVESSRKWYSFKSFMNFPSAFRLQTETIEYTVTNDDKSQSKEYQRITYRVPEAAPREIHNRYVRYIYNYEHNICVSRECQIVPDKLVEECREYVPAFDLEEFVEMLKLLPGTEDLSEFYSSFEKTEAGYKPIITSTSNYKECPSIGVIYSPGKSGGGISGGTSGGNGGHDNSANWQEWDIGTTDIIYYDYIKGNIHRIAIKEPGKDYGIYKLHETALTPYLVSDGVTEEELVSLFNTYSCFHNSGNVLFSSEENIKKTAQALVNVQEETDISVLYFLGIMRLEDAIRTDMGAHWNFFNIEASSQYGRPPIQGHSRFCDYTQIEADPWSALEREIKYIHTNYSKRNQTNAYLYCFNGYDFENWSSISMAYCPPWDDCSFPWAAGSGMGSPTGIGWPNRVGDFTYDFRQYIAALR